MRETLEMALPEFFDIFQSTFEYKSSTKSIVFKKIDPKGCSGKIQIWYFFMKFSQMWMGDLNKFVTIYFLNCEKSNVLYFYQYIFSKIHNFHFQSTIRKTFTKFFSWKQPNYNDFFIFYFIQYKKLSFSNKFTLLQSNIMVKNT